jgi:hypothetical protein
LGVSAGAATAPLGAGATAPGRAICATAPVEAARAEKSAAPRIAREDTLDMKDNKD